MASTMITILIGTNRPGSSTARVARIVDGIYRGLGETPAVVDLLELPEGTFSPAAYATPPPGLDVFAGKILQSDGLVVITPEYNGGMPGALKFFIDRLPFPESFEKRPVCFIGLAAGQWGALRPVEQLQSVFGYRNAFIYPNRVFLPGIGELLNSDGAFKDDAMLKRLEKQAAGFLEFSRALKPLR